MTSAKAVKADATHVVVAVDAAAVVVTALNVESAAKKAAASAPPAAVIDQNAVTVLSAVTATNVSNAPNALMAPTRAPQKVAHRVKNADAADAMALALEQAMRPTSPTCPTTPRPLAKWAVQKTLCKHKPRCAPRHATNALRVKTTAMLAKR
jgi:CCR4-NOT transcriptional regulation complex NOT5 subunit